LPKFVQIIQLKSQFAFIYFIKVGTLKLIEYKSSTIDGRQLLRVSQQEMEVELEQGVQILFDKDLIQQLDILSIALATHQMLFLVNFLLKT